MRRPYLLRRMTPFALVVLLLPACSDSVDEAGDTTLAPTTTTTTTSAPTTTTTVVESATTTSDVTGSEVAPFHEMPPNSVPVVGTATCIFSVPPAGLTVDCDLDLTDPRVSGAETTSNYQFVSGKNGKVWVADGVITNPDGTWTGSFQGAENASGSSPTGEAHYFGEGAYEGLEFHYYFMHPDVNEPAEIRGWIYESG